MVFMQGAAKIHILAHSMGNRIAQQALARLVSPSAPVTLPFGQLIFAAADEDSDVFTRTMTHLVQAGLGKESEFCDYKRAKYDSVQSAGVV